eukprot:scpid59976/ scgid22949/ KDEL motif-containing protein 1
MRAAVFLLALALACICAAKKVNISGKKSIVYGPGLNPRIVSPARYVFVQAVDDKGKNYTSSPGSDAFRFTVVMKSDGRYSHLKTKVFDRGDGTYQCEYFFNTQPDQMHIEIRTKTGEVVGTKDRYELKNPEVESCVCPTTEEDFAKQYGCRESATQIDIDFAKFPSITQEMIDKAMEVLNEREASIVHYVFKNGKIYAKVHGKYEGFKQYADKMWLALARRVKLPDMEFLFNMGDWPQSNLSAQGLPVVSWGASNDTDDIVVPTYKVVLGTVFGTDLENMREMDGLSYKTSGGWTKKKNKMIWRGRDCNKMRVDFVDGVAAENSNLIDAQISRNHFDYYPTPEDRRKDKRLHAGKKVKRMAFEDYFKYKYILNLDGTVAAYRLSTLLAGDSVVFKHDSKWHEHFYADLEPFVHYIPLKDDLSDTMEQLKWARNHDKRVRKIVAQSRQFVRDHLSNEAVYCYYLRVAQRYRAAMTYKPTVRKGMGLEEVKQEQPKTACKCAPKPKKAKKAKKAAGKDEL